jgi:penicillin-binding protein 2
MFERRLKILLIVMAVAGLSLLGRAFSLQVLHAADYADAERRLSTRPPELTATTRGRILDCRGAVLAADVPATDACVEYPAIVDPPDPKWVTEQARLRLKDRYGADFAPGSRVYPLAKRRDMLADESKRVVADVAEMWRTLANLYQPSDADAAADPRAAFDEVRRDIIHQVEMRRRLQWTAAYRRSHDQAAKSGGMLRWLGLAAGAGDGDDGAIGADIDAFQQTTTEQRMPHVVLHALDADACGLLGKQLDRFPGLSLRPSARRSYPLHDVFCHGVGRVSNPTADELRRTKDDDPRRQYQPADDVGRDGVEALCEPLLRGARGRIDRRVGDETVIDRQDFVPGQDVHVTIDADLQARLQRLLSHVVEVGRVGDDAHVLITPAEGVSMHGAAVVIDVRTNEVRALASNPGFDADELQARFAALNDDVINGPLINRATSDAVEPGSTVKPMLGLAGVTQGTVGPTEGIECTGNMYLPVIGPDGKRSRVRMKGGRCWVVSEYGKWLAEHNLPIDHHRVPPAHVGIDGNPDGWLTLSDALERSCDIYFETVADRMGPNDLCKWYDRWGLGRATGIGIHESPGLREDQSFDRDGGVALDYRRVNCLAGMGQDKTLATPLQIANAMAAIARGGVWMRPRLLSADTQAALDAVHPRPAGSTPDSVELHLSPAALEQAHIGMRNVVVAEGGTGQLPKTWDHPAWLTVAAKTGTADTAPFSFLVKGPDGRLVRSHLKPVVRNGPEGDTPWYRSETGTDLVHAWYVGYSPADDPQVAFAVLIEYAGIGGGPAAGPVAAGLLDACVADGYLRPPAGAATRP